MLRALEWKPSEDLRRVPVYKLVHERRVEECDVHQCPDKRRAVEIPISINPLLGACKSESRLVPCVSNIDTVSMTG